VANWLDEKTREAHIKKLHAANYKKLGIPVLAGSEVGHHEKTIAEL